MNFVVKVCEDYRHEYRHMLYDCEQACYNCGKPKFMSTEEYTKLIAGTDMRGIGK